MNQVEFKRPVKVGRIVKIYGKILSVGNTSVKLFLEARSHNPHTDIQKLVCSTEMVFVRLDQDGEPQSLSQKAKEILVP